MTAPPHRPPPNARRRLVLAALGGVVLTLAVFVTVRDSELALFQAQFERDAAIHTQLIRQQLELDLQTITSLKAFFSDAEWVTRQEFKLFAMSQLAERPEITCLEWVPRVPGAERAKWEDAARRDGLAGFRFTESVPGRRLVTAGKRDTYYPVYYLEPLAGNEEAAGYDTWPEPVRRGTLERARDTGQPTVTERLLLVQEKEGQAGLIVYAPIYRQGMPALTVEQRRMALTGFAVGILRAPRVLDAALTAIPPIGLTMDWLDHSAAPKLRLIHHRPSRNPGVPSWKTRLAGEPPRHELRFTCAGRHWGVRITPSNAYLEQYCPVGYWLVLPAGMMVTLFLCLSLLHLFSQQARTALLVQKRTAELTLAERELQQHREQLEEQILVRTAELSRANHDLNTSQARLRAAMDLAKLVYWEYDIPSDRFLFDDQFYALYGTTAEREGGTQMSAREYAARFIPVAHAAIVGNTLATVLATSEPHPVPQVEHPIRRRDGEERFIVVRIVAGRDPAGRIVKLYGVNQDITERKRAEEERQRLLEQTRRDAQTKADLLREVNHRVKNNLTAILGLILNEKKHATAGQPAILAVLEPLARRVRGLLTAHQLLSDNHWAPIHLAGLAERIIRAAVAEPPASACVTVAIEPSPVTISPRLASNLALVFNELATNSVKHAAGAPIAITLRFAQEGGIIRISYHDNGPGYPADVLTGRRQGAGLHLVRQLVTESMRGTQLLANAQGAATILTIRIEETTRT